MSQTSSAIATIRNKLGLHARPAMMFVDVASKGEASVTVKRMDNDECVDGKSIMQLMMLAATNGTKIEITTEGSDAEQLLQSLCDLIESRFGED